MELLLEPEPRGLAAERLELGDIKVLPAVNLDSRAAASRALAEDGPWAASLRGGELFLYPYCCRAEEPTKKEQFLAMGQDLRATQGAEP
jgi:hypothetical protein